MVMGMIATQLHAFAVRLEMHQNSSATGNLGAWVAGAVSIWHMTMTTFLRPGWSLWSWGMARRAHVPAKYLDTWAAQPGTGLAVSAAPTCTEAFLGIPRHSQAFPDKSFCIFHFPASAQTLRRLTR